MRAGSSEAERRLDTPKVGISKLPPPIIARFWAKVERRGDDECWTWIGALDSSGYGNFKLDRYRNIRAPRLAFALRYGLSVETLPSNLFCCHTCDNRRCCNPAHLFLAGNAVNLGDAAKKGRMPGNSLPGERNPRARLTAEQATAIRSDRRPLAAIAAEYGIHVSTVSAIRLGESWNGGGAVIMGLRGRGARAVKIRGDGADREQGGVMDSPRALDAGSTSNRAIAGSNPAGGAKVSDDLIIRAAWEMFRIYIKDDDSAVRQWERELVRATWIGYARAAWRVFLQRKQERDSHAGESMGEREAERRLA